MLSDKMFLVTGATGRLGTELVNRLGELGAQVLPVVLPGYPLKPKVGSWQENVAPIKIESEVDLSELPSPDYVINLHWVTNRTLSYTEQLVQELNYSLHRPHMLWEWLSHQSDVRIVNISSLKVYSHLNQNPISAEIEPRPLSPYGIAKFAAEKFFDAYFVETHCFIIHLRLCTVASFGEHPSQLVSRLCASAFKGERIRVNAGHTVHLLYAPEAVDLFIQAALDTEPGRYVIAPDPFPIETIAQRFEEVTGRVLNAEYTDLAPGIPDNVVISDIEQLRSSWARTFSLEEMIKDYVSRVHECRTHFS